MNEFVSKAYERLYEHSKDLQFKREFEQLFKDHIQELKAKTGINKEYNCS